MNVFGAAPYDLTQGDLDPPVAGTLMAGAAPIDLSLAVGVLFSLRARGASSARINRAAAQILQTPADPTSTGKVQYVWQAGDTDVPGVYDAQFIIDWGSGRTQAVPNDEYLTIVIRTSI